MQSPSHPIHHVPSEILSEIFIQCLMRTHPKRTEAPLNISSVCKPWRQIATSTPQLWSQIFIRNIWGSRPHLVHTLKSWIYRSGGYGFSFAIANYNPEFHDKNIVFDAILNVLLENSDAWKNVFLHMPRYCLVKFLTAIPTRTPNIQKLTVRVFDAFLIDHTRLPIDAKVVFSPCGTNLLGNLRSLNLQRVDQFDLIECLSRSPRIEEVRAWFNFSTEKSQPIHHHIDVCLAHLNYLDLTLDIDSWDQGKRGPFDHFHLPALKTLHLRAFIFQYRSHMCPLWDLCIEFACHYESSLENLEIDGRFFTTPRPFSGRLPKLKHLGIPMGDVNDGLIHGLVSRFPSSVPQSCQGNSPFESLCLFERSKDLGEANLRAIIDHATKEKSSTVVHPVIVVVTYDLFKSFSLPPGCVVQIMKHGDWKKGRRHDLYREIGWE